MANLAATIITLVIIIPLVAYFAWCVYDTSGEIERIVERNRLTRRELASHCLCGHGRDDHSRVFTGEPCLECGECPGFIGDLEPRPTAPVLPAKVVREVRVMPEFLCQMYPGYDAPPDNIIEVLRT